MRLKLHYTDHGFSVLSDGIFLFSHLEGNSPLLVREVKKAFKDGEEVEAVTLLTVIKALRAAKHSPEFLVELVLHRKSEGGYDVDQP